jgi:zinc protease
VRTIVQGGVAVGLAGIVALAAAAPAAARVFDPETATLANGLELVVIPNHRMPVVSHMVWYRVGAMDEPPGQSGLAHLLEHLMFKGTPAHPAGEFSRIIARNGGQENAFTSHDFTAYYQDIARDRLELVMTLEADRMRNLALADDQVAPERQVVLEERRQRTDNDPGALLNERADATLYVNHPYRRPVIGWAHEIAGLDAEDALAFYRQWYAPNNAIVVIAGDVTLADAKPLAERIDGVIPPAQLPARLDLVDPPPATERRVELTDTRVQQPAWQRAHPAPGYRSGDTKLAYPLEVLAEIIGGGATSRLYRRLVAEEQLAVSAGATYDPTRRGPAEFSLYAMPRDGIGLDRIEAAVDAEVVRLLQDGIGEDELARAKSRMVAEAAYARDSLGTPAQVLGRALAIGQSVADVEAWPDRIAAVTKTQVDAAARAILVGAGSVTARLERAAVPAAAAAEVRSPAPATVPSGSPTPSVIR